MAVFLTKVWSFTEPCGPLLFRLEGSPNSARGMLEDGDIVVFVGTVGEPTAAEDQGRLLAAVEPTRELVSALDLDLANPTCGLRRDGKLPLALWPVDPPGLEFHE